MNVNSLLAANTTNANKASTKNTTGTVNSKSTNGSDQSALTTSNSGDSLSISDFLTLLAAQLQNQDMMNPVQDTEFIAQLAQFTTLETTEKLLQATTASLELSNTNYAASLLGKDVTVAKATKDKDGNTILETHTGVVTGVSLFEGQPLVYLGDDAYDLQEIMAVGKLPNKVINPDKDDPKDPDDPNKDDDNTKPPETNGSTTPPTGTGDTE